MSQNQNDNLIQNEPAKNQSIENLIKGSIVEYLKNRGIKSENTTHKKIGQTTLVFTNKVEPATKEDDSLEASIRYLKFKRMHK